MKKIVKPWAGHVCGECRYAVEDENPINRNVKTGERFLLRCPFRTDFKGARFKTDSACEKFMSHP